MGDRLARIARDDWVVVAIFAVSRAVFIGAFGLRMDLGFLGFAPQMPDLGVLQHDFWRTVFYQHTQAPLFPFLFGLILKLSPFPDGITVQVVYLALGLALLLLGRRVFRALGLGSIASLVAVGLVALHPSLVVLENLPSYDYPTVVLVVWLVKVFIDYLRGPTLGRFGWVGGVAGALVLTRTVFHPLWFVIFIGIVVAFRRPQGDWRRSLAVAAIPAVVILACLIKNDVLYGQFSLTTWFGPNLSKMAAAVVTPAEQQRLIRAGEESRLFAKPVFYGYDTYAADMPPCTPTHRNVPVLASPTRPRSQSPNLNYECMLAVYRTQQADGIAFARHHPGRFLNAPLAGTQFYFEPASGIIYSPNVHRLAHYDDWFERLLFWRWKRPPVVSTSWGNLRVGAFGGVTLLINEVLLVVACLGLGLAGAIQARRGSRRVSDAAWAMVGFMVLWNSAVGSWLEINENARFRLPIEPFLLAALVFLAERLLQAIQSKTAR